MHPATALDLFLPHLKIASVPKNLGATFTPLVNLAFHALLGLSKIGVFMESDPKLIDRVMVAWPGIYGWSMYIFKTRIEGLDRSDERRKASVDVLPACWYSICSNNDLVRSVILASPSTVEIAAKLWLEEEDPNASARVKVPPGTSVLCALLKRADFDTLQRVLKVAGGKSNVVAKIMVTRLRSALKRPEVNPLHLLMYLDLLNALSRSPTHPFRNALLSANSVWLTTSALVKIASMVQENQDPVLLDAAVSSFGYLFNCLESADGFTWVSQAIGAGLLQAFCDISPYLSQLHPEDLDMTLEIFKNILPRYLVYRSVIEAVDTAMVKTDKSPHRERIMGSIGQDVWTSFRSLAEERALVLMQSDVMKKTHLTCDNVKVNSAFRRFLHSR